MQGRRKMGLSTGWTPNHQNQNPMVAMDNFRQIEYKSSINKARFGHVDIEYNIIYPLVNIQKAIENGHRNSGFSH